MTEPELPTIRVFGFHFWVPVIIVFVFSLVTFGSALWLTNTRAAERSDKIEALTRVEAADAKQAFLYTCYQANALRAESAARGQSGANLFEVLRASQIITDPATLLAIDRAIIDLTHAGPILDCTWPPIHTPSASGGPSATPPPAAR